MRSSQSPCDCFGEHLYQSIITLYRASRVKSLAFARQAKETRRVAATGKVVLIGGRGQRWKANQESLPNEGRRWCETAPMAGSVIGQSGPCTVQKRLAVPRPVLVFVVPAHALVRDEFAIRTFEERALSEECTDPCTLDQAFPASGAGIVGTQSRHGSQNGNGREELHDEWNVTDSPLVLRPNRL
jgi:hypothetical protein